jgi:thiol:disulfide interchange protein
MPTDPSRPRPRRWIAGTLLFLLVLAAAALLVLPIWLIRPFVPQTPGGIALAFALRRWAPAGTLLALVAGLILTVRLWRGGPGGPGGHWWRRTLAVLALVALGAAVAFSRQNVFEKMFHPLGGVASVPAAEARWVEDGDPVLAVTINGDAAAYPVRQVAYHHIVEDTVGGVPVAVTY